MAKRKLKLYVVSCNIHKEALYYLARDIDDLLRRCMDWFWGFANTDVSGNIQRFRYASHKEFLEAKRTWKKFVANASQLNKCELDGQTAYWVIYDIKPHEIKMLKKFDIISARGQGYGIEFYDSKERAKHRWQLWIASNPSVFLD